MNVATLYPLPHSVEKPLGRVLIDQGAISQDDLLHALDLQSRIDARLGEILLAEGLVDVDRLQGALSAQFAAPRIDLEQDPPDPEVQRLLSPSFCLEYGVLPWMRRGDVLMLATAHPERFEDVRRASPLEDLRVLPVLAEESAIRGWLTRTYGRAMVWLAERRVPDAYSCRNWSDRLSRRLMFATVLLGVLLWAAVMAPRETLLGLTLLAAGSLVLSMALKVTAGLTQMIARTTETTPDATVMPEKLPRVSVMVPLLQERRIASALIARLTRLTYPKALLDVVLVLEEQDDVTRQTLASADLPHWMRVVEVPASDGPTTKPRALNYALEFCHGAIVGVWDAEDEPAVDQIEQVVQHFHAAADDVACLQGILDYYNPRANWMARCFAIEYATWWRLFLPGVARLGFVVPLGGTTLFFRRDRLIELGGWDAYNVTEDADLGVRLARAGYRTELIRTVTMEEANCRPWAWVRQRSRWLKGFAITWSVHMRKPWRLWRDLGAYRFLGLQLFFISALSQFALAPLFWSFWILPFGLTHPVEPLIGTAGMVGLCAVFIGAEIASIALNMVAVSAPAHRHLLPWTPSMLFYFPLATIAFYKAFYELLLRPFFWDKTDHGHSLGVD